MGCVFMKYMIQQRVRVRQQLFIKPSINHPGETQIVQSSSHLIIHLMRITGQADLCCCRASKHVKYESAAIFCSLDFHLTSTLSPFTGMVFDEVQS